MKDSLGRITIISPPDIFETSDKGILTMHVDEQDQELITKFLKKIKFNEDLNIYFYDTELTIPWLFHAISRCEYKFINLDKVFENNKMIAGHLLSFPNTFYKTNNEGIATIAQFINKNRIFDIDDFLKRAFDVQN